MICMPYHESTLFETADYSTVLVKFAGKSPPYACVNAATLHQALLIGKLMTTQSCQTERCFTGVASWFGAAHLLKTHACVLQLRLIT
jgi:hypothetical protein